MYHVESGWLQGGTQHPGAVDKIKELENPKVKVSEPEVRFDHPTFTEHLNNVEIKEKETAVFQCKIEPSQDPTMKIGIIAQTDNFSTNSSPSIF